MILIDQSMFTVHKKAVQKKPYTGFYEISIFTNAYLLLLIVQPADSYTSL